MAGALSQLAGTVLANPFYDGVQVLGMPSWVAYVFGPILIVAGLAMLILWAPRAKRGADRYKQRQIVAYNRKYRAHVNDYEQTNMYLPLWPRMKMMMPIILGVCCVIIGIAWLVGNSLTSL